jgi:hypothetical protein
MYLLFLLLLLIPIGYGIYYFVYKQGGSTQTSYSPTAENSVDSNASTVMVGGRRKKRGNKKSTKTTMTTTGIYLLLGTLLVAYITSKFV